MSVPEGAEGLIGTHYRFPDYFDVGREKVREFANAVKDDHPSHFSEASAAEAGYDSTVASLTFLAVAGRRVQLDVFTKFDIPINLARVLHRDQKFVFHRPIMAGDRLYFDPGWTSGFYAGALWQAAALEPAGGMFARWALGATVDHFGSERSPTHDVGFMYGQSSLNAYEALCASGEHGGALCTRLRASVVSAADELLSLAASNPGSDR